MIRSNRLLSNYSHTLKFFITFSTLIAYSIWLTACSQPDLQSLRFGLAVAPITLDPRFATDAASMRINRLLYRALVDFDAKLQPMPDLATWEQLSPTHYRFHLSQDGRDFHDGRRLTAHDVKATYDFILTTTNQSPLRGALAIIKQIEEPDADTLDFLLNKPDPLFPGRLVVGIVPANLIQSQHPFNKQPLGSGKFQFIRWPYANHLVLQRCQDGQLVEFLEIKDPVVRVLKLLRGEIDLLQGNLSPELVAWLAQQPKIQIIKGEGTTFTYLGFNLQEPLTGQLWVRQAIAYAINRDDIIHYLMGNAARPATSFLLPATHWASFSGVPDSFYHPDQARALLAQAGYTTANPLHLTYKTSNDPFRLRIASVIQQQLAQVGIDLDLRSYDWGTFYGDIKDGRFQLFSLSWIGIKMPDIYHYVFHSDSLPPNGANRGRLKNPQIDTLIKQAEEATTLTEQAAHYHQLQNLLFQELPYVPLWYEDNVLVTRQLVKGYTLAPDGNYDGLIQVRKE